MIYTVVATPRFQKDVKQYKKRFRNVTKDLDTIIGKLAMGELLGDRVPKVNLKEIDEEIKKVRVINSDTKKGQSNGYRLIYYVVKNDGTIFLLTVYYKKDKENITPEEIAQIIKENVINKD